MSKETTNYAKEFETLEGVEIPGQRSECSKVYDLGCGRRQAVMFARPVHFKDASGRWQDIDNTLEETRDRHGRALLRNRANSTVMEFARHSGEVRMAREGHELRWKLRGGEHAEAVATTGEELHGRKHRGGKGSPQDRRSEHAAKMDAQVDYMNARPGLSLRYSVMGDAVKEDIILENAEAANDAVLLLPAGVYSYALGEDWRVHVIDGEEERFVFSAPVTYDAAGNHTMASVELETTGEGVAMRYVLDPEFLATATFPVTIDPVVRPNYDTGDVMDLF